MIAKQIIRTMELRGLKAELEAIAKKHGATLEEVVSNNRTKHLARARTACYVHLRDAYGYSPRAIADLFARDRTTVFHHIKDAPASDAVPKQTTLDNQVAPEEDSREE